MIYRGITANSYVVPLAAPLAVLQAAINAAADLSPRFVCAFDGASKRVKD